MTTTLAYNKEGERYRDREREETDGTVSQSSLSLFFFFIFLIRSYRTVSASSDASSASLTWKEDAAPLIGSAYFCSPIAQIETNVYELMSDYFTYKSSILDFLYLQMTLVWLWSFPVVCHWLTDH